MTRSTYSPPTSMVSQWEKRSFAVDEPMSTIHSPKQPLQLYNKDNFTNSDYNSQFQNQKNVLKQDKYNKSVDSRSTTEDTFRLHDNNRMDDTQIDTDEYKHMKSNDSVKHCVDELPNTDARNSRFPPTFYTSELQPLTRSYENIRSDPTVSMSMSDFTTTNHKTRVLSTDQLYASAHTAPVILSHGEHTTVRSFLEAYIPFTHSFTALPRKMGQKKTDFHGHKHRPHANRAHESFTTGRQTLKTKTKRSARNKSRSNLIHKNRQAQRRLHVPTTPSYLGRCRHDSDPYAGYLTPSMHQSRLSTENIHRNREQCNTRDPFDQMAVSYLARTKEHVAESLSTNQSVKAFNARVAALTAEMLSNNSMRSDVTEEPPMYQSRSSVKDTALHPTHESHTAQSDINTGGVSHEDQQHQKQNSDQCLYIHDNQTKRTELNVGRKLRARGRRILKKPTNSQQSQGVSTKLQTAQTDSLTTHNSRNTFVPHTPSIQAKYRMKPHTPTIKVHTCSKNITNNKVNTYTDKNGTNSNACALGFSTKHRLQGKSDESSTSLVDVKSPNNSTEHSHVEEISLKTPQTSRVEKPSSLSAKQVRFSEASHISPITPNLHEHPIDFISAHSTPSNSHAIVPSAMDDVMVTPKPTFNEQQNAWPSTVDRAADRSPVQATGMTPYTPYNPNATSANLEAQESTLEQFLSPTGGTASLALDDLRSNLANDASNMAEQTPLHSDGSPCTSPKFAADPKRRLRMSSIVDGIEAAILGVAYDDPKPDKASDTNASHQSIELSCDSLSRCSDMSAWDAKPPVTKSWQDAQDTLQKSTHPMYIDMEQTSDQSSNVYAKTFNKQFNYTSNDDHFKHAQVCWTSSNSADADQTKRPMISKSQINADDTFMRLQLEDCSICSSESSVAMQHESLEDSFARLQFGQASLHDSDVANIQQAETVQVQPITQNKQFYTKEDAEFKEQNQSLDVESSHVFRDSGSIGTGAHRLVQVLEDARCNRYNAVAAALQSGEIVVDDQDDEGMSPLLVAARYGHGKLARMLVHTFQADLTCVDTFGNTALHHSLQQGHRNLAKYFLTLGVDDRIYNDFGETCYDVLPF